MLYGNQMEEELLKHGLIEKKYKRKKRKHKKFTCHLCGAPMVFKDETNVMVCSKCNQFFIFDKD